MARPVTTLVVFFLCFNLFSGLLLSTGVAADVGLVETDVGGEQERESLENTSDSVPSGSGIGETLFGLYNVLTNFVGDIFGFVTAGPTMLANAGVPGEITRMLNVIFGVLVAIDVVSFFRGWGL